MFLGFIYPVHLNVGNLTKYTSKYTFNHMDPSWDTPRKINMEHNHGGLEDHFPFQIGDL